MMTPVPVSVIRRRALIGVAFLHIGMAAWVPTTATSPDLAILYERLPVEARVVLWTAAALVIASGIVWPRLEPVAFTAAVIMPVERAAGHAWSWVHAIDSGPPPGDPAGWAVAMVWLAVAGLVVLLGGAHDAPREDA